MAAGEFRLSMVFLGARHCQQAAQVSGSAAEALAPLAETGPPGAVALRGALTLQRAVAAGRLNRADEAYAHLREARELAERVGEGRNDYNTEFGPTNVRLHEVAVAVDPGDAGVADVRAEPSSKQLVSDLVAMSPLPSDQPRAMAHELGVQVSPGERAGGRRT